MAERVISAHEKALTKELADLSKQQSEALQRAIYLRMSTETAKEYDARAKRIGEICAALTKIRDK